MFAADLHELYKKLNDSLILSPEEINESATLLLDAPENDFITKKMRLEAIVMHPNYSRAIYDRILNEFPPETLASEDTNILHMLLSNENATLEDVLVLSGAAEQNEKNEWFNTVLLKTIDFNEYQLNLSYNGEPVFQDESMRTSLTTTVNLLKDYLSLSVSHKPCS